MPEPIVTYVLSVVADERLQALRGEAAVMTGDDVVWSGKVSRAEIDGHVSWAVVELARQAKEALDAATATKPDAAPPPTQPRRPARKRAQGNVTMERGVSRSRLR
jgi:hypothetical protein